MARYYEETALIEFIKQYTPNIEGETTLECVERAILNAAPTADVAPKSEVAREILSDLKKAVHDKAVYSYSKDMFPYINLKVFDAILQDCLNKLEKR